MTNDVAKTLIAVLETIKKAAENAKRNSNDVILVAVSKTQSFSTIEWALKSGHRVFGENKVQEAENKWPALKLAYSDVLLHLIGPLQSNKVKRAVQIFDVIETVDRLKVARALAREMGTQNIRPQCYIQVNTGEEKQKAGILPSDVDDFIRQCRDELGLPIVGLMCIPPVGDNPSLHFGLLSEMAKRNGLEKLSMGMSSDYEVAVEFGATSVRVGTAIFGSRTRFKDEL
jgi:pyridoxal phosphate enzyme (YggS family)